MFNVFVRWLVFDNLSLIFRVCYFGLVNLNPTSVTIQLFPLFLKERALKPCPNARSRERIRGTKKTALYDLGETKRLTLGEPGCPARGTDASGDTIRFSICKVRTPKASLVGKQLESSESQNWKQFVSPHGPQHAKT